MEHGEEQNGLFVVHHVAGPHGLPVSCNGDYEQEGDDYVTYDEQNEQHQQPQYAIPQQIRVLMMVPKQCRANYANFYYSNRRLQSIPEAPYELSDRSSTVDDCTTNQSSARNSRILENGIGLGSGAHSQEEIMALLNAASIASREQYAKLWPDSITPHKLAIRQLLSSPDLPFIDAPDGSAAPTTTASQTDLTAAAVNNGQLEDDAGSAFDTQSRTDGQSKPFGKSPRFVKKLVGFACCCAPKNNKV